MNIITPSVIEYSNCGGCHSNATGMGSLLSKATSGSSSVNSKTPFSKTVSPAPTTKSVTSSPVATSPTPVTPVEEPKKDKTLIYVGIGLGVLLVAGIGYRIIKGKK